MVCWVSFEWMRCTTLFFHSKSSIKPTISKFSDYSHRRNRNLSRTAILRDQERLPTHSLPIWRESQWKWRNDVRYNGIRRSDNEFPIVAQVWFFHSFNRKIFCRGKLILTQTSNDASLCHVSNSVKLLRMPLRVMVSYSFCNKCVPIQYYNFRRLTSIWPNLTHGANLIFRELICVMTPTLSAFSFILRRKSSLWTQKHWEWKNSNAHTNQLSRSEWFFLCNRNLFSCEIGLHSQEHASRKDISLCSFSSLMAGNLDTEPSNVQPLQFARVEFRPSRYRFRSWRSVDVHYRTTEGHW